MRPKLLSACSIGLDGHSIISRAICDQLLDVTPEGKLRSLELTALSISGLLALATLDTGILSATYIGLRQADAMLSTLSLDYSPLLNVVRSLLRALAMDGEIGTIDNASEQGRV
jgi:hypothetical protein